MPCSVPIYDPRTSRRPKSNSPRFQYRAVLCSRLRPENVTSAQAEQSPVPNTLPCSVSGYVPRTSRRPPPPAERSPAPRTVSCSVPVYVPSTSRRPKPNSHRSQDRAVLCVPSTSRKRRVVPSRTVAGPKTVSVLCSRLRPENTSRRPKPNSRRSQDRVVLCFRLRPENVTSAQAEQSPVQDHVQVPRCPKTSDPLNRRVRVLLSRQQPRRITPAPRPHSSPDRSHVPQPGSSATHVAHQRNSISSRSQTVDQSRDVPLPHFPGRDGLEPPGP